MAHCDVDIAAFPQMTVGLLVHLRLGQLRHRQKPFYRQPQGDGSAVSATRPPPVAARALPAPLRLRPALTF